jgi:hypothetical protein
MNQFPSSNVSETYGQVVIAMCSVLGAKFSVSKTSLLRQNTWGNNLKEENFILAYTF